MIASTVTKRGQTTIPKKIREALELEDGSRLLYELDGEQVIIRPQKNITDFIACLKPDLPKGQKLDWREVHLQAQKDWERS